jgi:YVTN family beta-propeller protein
LHPSDLELSADQRTLYVANANSDTVSVIDTTNLRVMDSVLVRPDPTLPFGSAPNALTLSQTAKLFCGRRQQCVAVVALERTDSKDSFPPPGIRVRSSAIPVRCQRQGLGSRQPGRTSRAGTAVGIRTVSKSRFPLPPNCRHTWQATRCPRPADFAGPGKEQCPQAARAGAAPPGRTVSL